jgi:hypothetical protein
MPRATVSTETQKYNLKSLEGGYIVARPLSYGQKKARADKSGQMYAEMQERGVGDRMYIETITTAATLYDFQHCIFDHNLEDDDGRKLDFNNAATLDVLDPHVGGEIEEILAKLNGDDADMRDFTSRLNGSSDETPTAVTE